MDERCQHCGVAKKGMFSNFSPEQLELINSMKQSRQVRAGERLKFNPDHIYCVGKGVMKEETCDREGHTLIQDLLVEGDLVIKRSERELKALEDSRVCGVPKKIFESALRESPETMMAFMQHLGEKVAKLEKENLELKSKNVEQRLAKLVLGLVEKFGERRGDEVVIQLSLTREDFAQLVGTATETVIRTLAAWKKLQIIRMDEVNKRRIVILNVESLKNLVEN